MVQSKMRQDASMGNCLYSLDIVCYEPGYLQRKICLDIIAQPYEVHHAIRYKTWFFT